MRTQYMIKEGNKEKRKEFFEYIKKTYKLRIGYPYLKKKFINSPFPFVVDFQDNRFWVCESITCCALATTNKLLFTIDEFKSIINSTK